MIEKKEAPVIGQEAVQYQNLRLGSHGEDVKKLQTALDFTGPDVDGIYGQKTQQAVMDYQRNNNLTVDGIAGQQTQTALYRNAGASGDATVDQAQQILSQNLGNQSYTPVWEDAAKQYLQQYQNREPFSYDFATDALWQQYADQYANSAKLAMMDTMGQAAAMTGGYGSTWAQSVGQQAYNQQMSQLNNIIPELESRAYDRYQQEGNDLLTQYSLYRDLEDQEYAKWRDAVADYQWQQSFDESKRQFDASRYSGGGTTQREYRYPDEDTMDKIQTKFENAASIAAVDELSKLYESLNYDPAFIANLANARKREIVGKYGTQNGIPIIA